MINRSIMLVLVCSYLLLTGCDDSLSSPNNNASDLSQVYTYKNQILAPPLRDPASCVNYSRSCSIEELPFIAMSYPETKIQQVMLRVVVSHDWMGERFATLLTLLPDEVLTLLGSVTAIVIADNIRPSFYWTGSGAIYLDPASLWLTNDEKLTIDKTEDYREDFSNGLSYDFFHRFVKDNKPAYNNYSLSNNQERSIDDIIIPMASLLFHELAHANDFMPLSVMSSLDISKTALSSINSVASEQLNTQLQRTYPINDERLKTHASILYRGQQATEKEILTGSSELGTLFELEGANHLYAYSHQAEDVAMLFQATMLSYYFDIKMDSAFVIQPATDSKYCADFIVGWGQRDRIADPISKPRAQFVSQQLLPSIQFSTFFDQLSPPQLFPPLSNWCNISLSQVTTINTQTRSAAIAPLEILKKDHHHGVLTAFK